MKTEAPSPIDTSRGISRRDFLLKGLLGIFGVAAVAAFLKWGPFHLSSSTEGLVLPDTFSNETNEGVMGDRNTILLSSKQAETVFPQQIVENRENFTATIPCPFQALEGDIIKYTRDTYNPSTVPFDPTRKVIGERIPWQNANIRTFEAILPKGTKVFAPVDANYYLAGGISLIHYTPDTDTTDTGTTYIIRIGGGGLRRAPFLQGINNVISSNWEKYHTVKRGTLLFEAIGEEDLSCVVLIEAYSGKDISPKAVIVEHKKRVLSPQFATLNGKLLVIGNT